MTESKSEGQFLPSAFQKAEWRCTTPFTTDGRMGLGFTLHNGTKLFLSLSKESAFNVQETIRDYFMHSHSERSEGMPSLDTSTSKPGETV